MTAFREAPTLETARLRLRDYRPEDFSFFRAIWADPEVTRFIGGEPRGEEEVWTKFLRMIGHWRMMGFGYWAVEEKATGALIGETGLCDFKRDMAPSIKGELEAGWVLTSAAQGKGYATEAMTAVVDWAAAHFPDKRMCCIIEPANAASIRVAEKLGFVENAKATYHGEEILLFRRG